MSKYKTTKERWKEDRLDVFSHRDVHDYILPTSPWIKYLKNFVHIFFPSIISFFVLVAGAIIFGSPNGVGIIFVQLIIAFILYKLLLWYGRRNLPHFRSEYVESKSRINNIFFLILLSIPLIIGSNCFLGIFESSGQEFSFGIGLAVLAISTFIVPKYEELTRYLTMRNCEKLINKQWIIVFIQALCFAVLHISPISIVYAFISGLTFGYVYYKTNKIANTYFMHALFNACSIIPFASFLNYNVIALGIIAGACVLLECFLVWFTWGKWKNNID